MIEQILHFTLPAARGLLPPPMMESPRAWAMLLAIGLQESKFLHRQQKDSGPARGFWQFERGGGTVGVMTHPLTKPLCERILRELRYGDLIGNSRNVHYTLRDNDLLAACFARMLLWTVPARLPGRDDPGAGWLQYIEGWRPGRPHPESWDSYYAEAWNRLEIAWPQVTGGTIRWTDIKRRTE